MNPSKRDMEAYSLFYDLDDGEQIQKLELPDDWKSIDIINCTYENKLASFTMEDIIATFFPGCDPVYTVEIKYNNNKTKVIPFQKIADDEIIDLFTIVDSE